MAIFHEPHYLASRVYTLSRKETHCMDKTLAIVLIGGLTASLQAFAGGGPPPAGIAPPKRIPLPAAAMSAGEPVNTAAVPPEVRRAVVADAARRFKVAENLVVLTGAERLTWKDGSLGCPEPGMSYTQALGIWRCAIPTCSRPITAIRAWHRSRSSRVPTRRPRAPRPIAERKFRVDDASWSRHARVIRSRRP
jgi:hypothetical protein